MLNENERNIELLENFLLENPELEYLENLLVEFNIFETLKIARSEIRHSNVLSWLLDPTENHGLGNYFIKQFMQYLIMSNKSLAETKLSLFDIESFKFADIEVLREWKNIDILLLIKEYGKEYAIVIENKINIGEHSNQLSRYKKIIDHDFEKRIKIYVYLTPDKTIPSEESWFTFDYMSICNILSKILKHKSKSLNLNIAYFLDQYNLILRRYVVGGSEIENICKKIYTEHRKALDLIFQYRPDVYSDVTSFIQGQLGSNKLIVEENKSKYYVYFISQRIDEKIRKLGEEWFDSKRMLLFEFDNYYGGLALKIIIGPGDQKYRAKLIEFSKKHNGMKIISIADLVKYSKNVQAISDSAENQKVNKENEKNVVYG